MDSTLLQRAKDSDLLALAGRYTALRPGGGGEYVGPCPMCGGNDRFYVKPDSGRWGCRNCSRGYRDVIGLQMAVTGQTFIEAVNSLAGNDDLPRTESRTSAHTPYQEMHGPPSPEWQARAEVIIERAQEHLWGEAGKAPLNWNMNITRHLSAREYLEARGLTEPTIRAARLGFIPEDAYDKKHHWGLPEQDGKTSVYLPRGILIPGQVHNVTWYLKARSPLGTPKKYPQVTGSRPALYWAQSMAGHEDVVFCEGEFDTLLLWQQAGGLAGVVTLGSASNRLDVGSWGLYLLGTSRRWLAGDTDAAGEKGAAALAWLKGAQRLEVPRLAEGDKDISDFHRHGGDLRAWLAERIGFVESSEDADENAKKRPSEAFSGEPGHLLCPETLAIAQSHPAYIPGLPICRQPVEVEEAWWAAVFAGRGIPDREAPLFNLEYGVL